MRVLETLDDGAYYGDEGLFNQHHNAFRAQVDALVARHPDWLTEGVEDTPGLASVGHPPRWMAESMADPATADPATPDPAARDALVSDVFVDTVSDVGAKTMDAAPDAPMSDGGSGPMPGVWDGRMPDGICTPGGFCLATLASGHP